MDTPTRHPLERAADGAIERAEAMGGHAAAHWNHETEDWVVRSATDPDTTYTVRRVRPDGGAERSEAQERAGRGWWWFTLDCSCQDHVDHKPWAVCKHKACVRLWQLHYQRRDGRAWGTLPAHSNAIAQVNADYDPDGVETWKDKEPRVREPDIFCDCPDDPCLTPGCPCGECDSAPFTDDEGRYREAQEKYFKMWGELPW